MVSSIPDTINMPSVKRKYANPYGTISHINKELYTHANSCGGVVVGPEATTRL